MHVCIYLYDGMDDLRGIVTEVKSMAQLFNGLQGCPGIDNGEFMHVDNRVSTTKFNTHYKNLITPTNGSIHAHLHVIGPHSTVTMYIYQIQYL